PASLAYQMPDDRLYRYSAGLYQWVEGWDSDEFYDPISVRVIHRYHVYDSRGQNPVHEVYYYFVERGDYFFYDEASGRFERHDLISDFEDGDLLYGTEEQRRRVRPAIRERVPNAHYITADDIHREISLCSDVPQFVAFDDEYENFLRGYGL